MIFLACDYTIDQGFDWDFVSYVDQIMNVFGHLVSPKTNSRRISKMAEVKVSESRASCEIFPFSPF
jgi:hypothetical protein